MTVEVLLLTPVLTMLVMLIVYAGRYTEASIRVHRAADVGARVASISKNSQMLWKGELAARTDIRLSKSSCQQVDVNLRTSRIGKLMTVTTTVSCVVPVMGLGLLSLPTRRVEATSTEVIDYYTSRS
jgi:Flp pilus assembly protein TadG